ncbi:MAG: Hsp33 family molecular chaperone HslO [Lachnospiraceae bacterium]|nr:Hsp33 family molecular chaperone HslO [Lachnospiraceae bacterium]
MYNDYIIRGTAADEQIRFFAATTRNLVEEARKAHNTSPVATAALGRLMTGATMMGRMMKGDDDLITLIVKGDGPIGGITVTADALGRVKGYVNNPDVILHAKENGHLDVGGAVGRGFLQVIRDTGLKEPYVGQTDLISGEIAEDLTVYFATSEQVPSAVGLGVLMSKDNTVKQAGGFIIQVMPDASDEVISQLEKKLTEVTDISGLLDEGMTPEEIIGYVMEGMNPEVLETTSAGFFCNCSKDRISRVLAGLGKKDLEDIIKEGKDIEVNCHFCEKTYSFSPDELREILENG